MTPRPEKRILVTAALPYANGPIHVGHLAGAYLPADIYCRYQRLQGREIVFICGSDEHGVPILLRARQEGVSPTVIVDRYHTMIQDAFRGFGMSFDYYGRTSSATHRQTSQEFFRALAKKDAFVLHNESQLYDPQAELFLADRFIRGTCPKCGHPEAYGDQCENCGSALSPAELIDPRSAITDATPVKRETTHWYLPLARSQPWLTKWIDERGGWKANVHGQIQSWLSDGLADRAMSRDLPWGVPFPPDVAEAEGVEAQGKVLYVWFDAPIGYISATREWAAQQGEPEAWKRYWCDQETKLVHFIGKDNIVFHCIIFPAMLHLHGGFVLPTAVPANEFLNLRGLKFSTSRGVAVWLHEFLEKFPPDYLRYTVATILPETRDADFAWEDLQARVNNELADTLGNFVNRALTFAHKYFEGRVPALEQPESADRELLGALPAYANEIGGLINAYRIRDAVSKAMALARAGNKYFNDQQPWASWKDDRTKCGNTIHTSLQVMASLSVFFEPFLPFSASKMRTMLGLEGVRSSEAGGAGGSLGWNEAGSPLLRAGQPLGNAEILFTKIEDETIKAEVAELTRRSNEDAVTESKNAFPPIRDTIPFEAFEKVDLRVGQVLEATRVPKSKKLIRCSVDLGVEKRQVLAGVAAHLGPEDLVGRKVAVLANLAPRKMMGLTSEGMLLMAEDKAGRLVPVAADGAPGSPIR